jgi:hypothetical protein
MRIPRLEAETRGTDHGIIGALFEMVNAAPKVAPGPPFLLRCIADPTQTESRSPAAIIRSAPQGLPRVYRTQN